MNLISNICGEEYFVMSIHIQKRYADSAEEFKSYKKDFLSSRYHNMQEKVNSTISIFPFSSGQKKVKMHSGVPYLFICFVAIRFVKMYVCFYKFKMYTFYFINTS